MRITIRLILLNLACAVARAEDASLDSVPSKAGYALGWQYMKALQEDNMAAEVDQAALLQGMEDARLGHESRLPSAEEKKGLDYYTARKMINHQAMLDQIKKEGQAFLQQNHDQEGVTTLASGLQYQVLQSGDAGNGPKDDDAVKIFYRITDIHEHELGKTPGEQPQTALLSNLMPGWREALLLMKPGDRWRLFLPPELGYGDKPGNAAVKPNQTLVTELQLVAVAPPQEAKLPDKQAASQSHAASVVKDSGFSFKK